MRVVFGIFAVVVLFTGPGQHSLANEFVHISGGEFRSVIPEGEDDNRVAVADFLVQEAPVTNAEFLRFVLHHPEWQRGRAVSLFVDDQYLSTWASPISLGPQSGPQQPVRQKTL